MWAYEPALGTGALVDGIVKLVGYRFLARAVTAFVLPGILNTPQAQDRACPNQHGPVMIVMIFSLD